MPRTTATVETLTAEVRVLMVGSRQITLSVYGQLDEVESHKIEPFGRVSPKEAERGWTYVVGKHTETGELVRSATRTDRQLIERYLENLKNEARVLDRNAEAYRGAAEENRADRQRWIDATNQASDAALALYRKIETESVTMEADAVKWENLPLIVLAGLR